MVQVVCRRWGRYSQVKSKKEIMSITEGSISSLGIMSPDLTRSYSFIIPTAVSVPCPIFPPTSPKGSAFTKAQCFYKVSLSSGSNHPPAQQLSHRAVSSKQNRDGTTAVPGSGLLVTLHCQGPAHICYHGLGSTSRWHRESPKKARPESRMAPSTITEVEAVGDPVLLLHIH